jgi:hypothetical protein
VEATGSIRPVVMVPVPVVIIVVLDIKQDDNMGCFSGDKIFLNRVTRLLACVNSFSERFCRK